MRHCAVEALFSPDATSDVDGGLFRQQEGLKPVDPAAARADMAALRESGFLQGQVHRSITFELGIALHLGRPIVIVTRHDGNKGFRPIARLYGDRAANVLLVLTSAHGESALTVPSFDKTPLWTSCSADSMSSSVVEFNGEDHLDPWCLRREDRMQMTAAATPAGVAHSVPTTVPHVEEEDRASSSATDSQRGTTHTGGRMHA